MQPNERAAESSVILLQGNLYGEDEAVLLCHYVELADEGGNDWVVIFVVLDGGTVMCFGVHGWCGQGSRDGCRAMGAEYRYMRLVFCTFRQIS